jgi:DNA-binding transcriptional regulator YiaG
MHWRYKGDPVLEPLLYGECGLDDVYLRGGYERIETPHGAGIVVKDLDDLHNAITLYLVTEKKVLSGKELRFLRKQLDLTQAELGRRLRLSDQQVARWEKEQCEISGPADLLLRLLCAKHLGVNVDEALDQLEQLIERDTPVDERAVFTPTRDGWQKAA